MYSTYLLECHATGGPVQLNCCIVCLERVPNNMMGPKSFLGISPYELWKKWPRCGCCLLCGRGSTMISGFFTLHTVVFRINECGSVRD